MKKALVMLMLFLLPFATEAMVSEADYMESLGMVRPLDRYVGGITEIIRDPDNDMNIVLSVQAQIDNRYEPEPAVEPEPVAGTILVRDKEGIIEETLTPGMSVVFDAYYLGQDFIQDYSNGGTELTFLAADGRVAAQLEQYSAEREGYQIGIDITEAPTIATIETTADCMPGRDDVCHPIVHIDSLINGKVVVASLESGDEFPTVPPQLEHIYITDAHTYAEYADTKYTNFANIELFLVFNQTEDLVAENALVDAPSELSEIGTTYCRYSFSESGSTIEKTCSLLDRIKNFIASVKLMVDDLFNSFNDPYEYEIC